MTETRTGPASRAQRPVLLMLAGVVFGITLGLGEAAVSTDFPGYRAPAGLAALAASLAGAYHLRRYSPKTPLVRVASWTLLGGATVAAVVGALVGTVVGHRSWEGGAALTAAVLATTAVLITDSERALDLLFGVAFVGGGVAVVGAGVAVLRGGDLLAGVAGVGGGVAVVGMGVAELRGGHLLGGVAVVGVGVAGIGVGVAELRGGHLLAGVAFVGAGVALVGVGVAVLRGGHLLYGVAGVGLGVAGVGVGAAVLRGGQLLAGVAGVGAGVAGVSVGVTVAWRTGLPARAWGRLTAPPAEPVESPPGAALDLVDDAATPVPTGEIPPPGST